ncbi:MAG: electron transfer flavoprotein subunit alpha/FixB family protein [Nitrososphaerales archaeon]
MSANKIILTYSEEPSLALEALSAAQTLASKASFKVGAVAIKPNPEWVRELAAHGAEVVYQVEDGLQDVKSVDLQLDTLLAVVEQSKPEAVLIGGSRRGRELAPRLAARMGSACAADCISFDVDSSGRILSTRMVYGGAANIVLAAKASPLVASIRPKTFEKLQRDESRKADVISVKAKVGEPKVKIISTITAEKGSVNLRSSSVIVTAGRGVKKKEDLAIVEELANVVGGVLAGTRPLVEDLKWLPKERQVGLSGETVKPNLYIAVGVSGQIHHIVGMKDSRVIVAINTDEKAPIFQVCDYGIVGDLYQVVPELTKALKALLNKS